MWRVWGHNHQSQARGRHTPPKHTARCALSPHLHSSSCTVSLSRRSRPSRFWPPQCRSLSEAASATTPHPAPRLLSRASLWRARAGRITRPPPPPSPARANTPINAPHTHTRWDSLPCSMLPARLSVGASREESVADLGDVLVLLRPVLLAAQKRCRLSPMLLLFLLAC